MLFRSEVIGQWRWDGSIWQPVTLTDAIIAGIDLSKLVSNGNLSEVIANKMFADLFAANKITAQELAVGAVTAENIASGAIRADEIVGGSFTGETFEGGTFTGGLFKTSDALPGEVSLRDDAMVFDSTSSLPGIRITPSDTSSYNLPPCIYPSALGMVIYGGRLTTGAESWIAAEPAKFGMTRRFPAGNRAEIGFISGEVSMRQYAADGAESSAIYAAGTSVGLTIPGKAEIRVSGSEAYMRSTSGGVTRTLSVDGNGVWAKQGSTAVSLVPEVRPFQYSALWNADQSPAPIMVQHLPGGKLCQAQIRIQNLTGSSLSLPNETWVTLNYNPIPADLRGGFTDYIETTLPQSSARGRVEMNYSTGRIRIRNMSGADIAWTNNNSIWFPMRWFSPN